MGKAKLSGRVGAGQDACGVLQSMMDLADTEERVLVFRLGAGKDMYSALETVKKCRGARTALQSLERIREFWKTTLSAIRMSTPDQSINFLFNGWLNYQTIASRIWGRSGFYQSGGAFGFPRSVAGCSVAIAQ